MSRRHENLMEIFRKTRSLDLTYEGEIEKINHNQLNCMAGLKDNLHTEVMGGDINLSMFNYTFRERDAVLMLISLPIVGNERNRQLPERIGEIFDLLEDCFITLDYLHLDEVKEDHKMYITAVKIIKEEHEKKSSKKA